MGAAGAGGVEIKIGRDGTAAAGAGGVANGTARADVGATGVGGAAGLFMTGGLTEGKPIMVRLRGGREAPGAGVEAVGCGVIPVRAMGMAADGRAPGINDGRGDGGAAGAGAAPTAGTWRTPDGRVGGFAHADDVEAGAAGALRSIVISP
jgi:hypothetical protein